MSAREGLLADQLRVVPPGVSLIQVQDQGGDILASGTLTVTDAPSTPFLLVDGGGTGH